MQAKRKDNSSVVTVQPWMPSPELARAIAQQQSNKHKNSSKAKRLALEQHYRHRC